MPDREIISMSAYRMCTWIRARRKAGKLLTPEGCVRPPGSRGSWWFVAVLPTLASRLADRLDGRAVPPPVAEADIVTLEDLLTRELMSAAQWREFTALVSRGLRVSVAIRQSGIKPRILRRYLRFGPQLRVRLEYAKKWGRRRAWSPILLDEILSEVACTPKSLRQICAERGVSYNAFISLTRHGRDPELEAEYHGAKWVQATHMADAVLGRVDGADEATLAAMATRAGRRQLNQAWHRIDQLRAQRPLRRANREAAARENNPLAAARQRLKTMRRRANS
jgi:terminase small subunit-like protein